MGPTLSIRTLCAFSLVGAACTELEAVLQGAPCPCNPDQVCCATLDRCLEPEVRCPVRPVLERVDPAQGPVEGGYPVRLVGLRLEAIQRVWVGDRDCPILRTGVDGLDCQLPSGPAGGGRAAITVQADGERAQLFDGFQWLAYDFIEHPVRLDAATQVFGEGLSVFDLDRDGQLEVLFSFAGAIPRMPVRPLAFFVDDFALRPGPPGPEVPRHGGIAAADLDSDGRTDLVTSGLRGEPALTTLFSTDDGFVTAPQSQVAGSEFRPPRPLDWEGDGDLDLVGCQGTQDEGGWVMAVENDGGELRNQPEWTERIARSVRCSGFHGHDLDLDGRVDWMAVGGTFGVPWFRQGTRLVPRIRDDTPVADAPLADGALADVDLDGDPDAVMVFRSRPNSIDSNDPEARQGLWVLLNRVAEEGEFAWEEAPGSLELGSLLPCFSTARTPQVAQLRHGLESLVMEDFDLDGDEDIFLPLPTALCGAGPHWYENRASEGELGFVLRPASPFAQLRTTPTGMVAADLDRDGDLDVVVHQGGAGDMVVYENVVGPRSGVSRRSLTVRTRTDSDGDASDPDRSDDRSGRALLVQVDLDGPDFALGLDRILSRVMGEGGGRMGIGPPERVFGLGGHRGPVWVRVRFADGSQVVRRVEPGVSMVELVDCDGDRCP